MEERRRFNGRKLDSSSHRPVGALFARDVIVYYSCYLKLKRLPSSTSFFAALLRAFAFSLASNVNRVREILAGEEAHNKNGIHKDIYFLVTNPKCGDNNFL